MTRREKYLKYREREKAYSLKYYKENYDEITEKRHKKEEEEKEINKKTLEVANNHNTKWTSEEDYYVETHMDSESLEEIALALGRTLESVKHRKKKIKRELK